MHRILKGSRLEIFEDAGHMPQYECPEKFNESSYITGQALAVDGGNTASLNLPGMKV